MAVGANVAAGGVELPALVVKDKSLQGNIDVMARYAASHGFELAPHGKTTMAPAIFRRQLRAGAWGITVADVAQARVALAAGAQRALIANEVVGAAEAATLAASLRDASHEVICLVDSSAGAELLDGHLGRLGATGRQQVMVELGFFHGRAGARSQEEALAVAATVARSTHLVLVGVEGYEGGIASDRTPASLAAVDEYLERVRSLTVLLAERGLFSGRDHVLVSAGGSKYFDRVANVLGPSAGYGRWPVKLVVRAGCYVSHDHGYYQEVSPLAAGRGAESLQPALELWASVLSVPEPGTAIVGLGRRDTSFDLGLPVPLHHVGAAGAHVQPFRSGKMTRLDDQHGYFSFPDMEVKLCPGDRIGFGLSHPCTAFDKWSRVLLVDDGYGVLDVLETSFH